MSTPRITRSGQAPTGTKSPSGEHPATNRSPVASRKGTFPPVEPRQIVLVVDTARRFPRASFRKEELRRFFTIEGVEVQQGVVALGLQVEIDWQFPEDQSEIRKLVLSNSGARNLLIYVLGQGASLQRWPEWPGENVVIWNIGVKARGDQFTVMISDIVRSEGSYVGWDTACDAGKQAEVGPALNRDELIQILKHGAITQ